MKTPYRLRSLSLIHLVFLLVFATFAPLFNGLKASALSGAEFNPGRIIDDGIFYNSSSMTVEQIQNFLDSKLTTCDTNGDQSIFDPSTGTTVTRKVYSERRGVSTPFICLKSYHQEVPSVVNGGSDLCKGSIGAGDKTSAQIIKDVASACGINPQVLLVLLQKEQSLVTDDWPWPVQYRSATGYGCPDTAPCDAEFYGFFNQVYQAAKAFRRYEANPTNYNYRAGRNNTILWHPNAACGSSNVYIENQATASLYIYTPYRPNQAALDNLYGTGDGCSSYGNRNFWRMFNDWFGSPIGCPGVDPNYVYRLYRNSDSNYLYTQNPAEICQAVQYYGYIIEGPLYINDVTPTDIGARSVYRLSRNGVYIFTTDTIERDMAMQFYGYRYEGVAYYVSSVSTDRYPVYRLSKNGRYVFTVSLFEKAAFESAGFSYEGTPYYANSSGAKIPIYRISKNGQHLYTSSDAEKVFAVLFHGYQDEGIAFYGITGQAGDNLLVYRLNKSKNYLNTIFTNEKFIALSSGYSQETSYFYAYPPNYPGTVPVYRLSNAQTGDYLLTTNAAEKDMAVQMYGYRYEGVGFNGAP